jgi:hypothetical protein
MTSLFGSPASGEIEGKNNEVIREICYTNAIFLNILHIKKSVPSCTII